MLQSVKMQKGLQINSFILLGEVISEKSSLLLFFQLSQLFQHRFAHHFCFVLGCWLCSRGCFVLVRQLL